MFEFIVTLLVELETRLNGVRRGNFNNSDDN